MGSPTQPVVKKRRKSYNVSPTLFCLVWNDANSVEEVAKKLKMPKGNVLARASSYRKAKIQLKKMERSNSRAINAEQLNRLMGRKT